MLFYTLEESFTRLVISCGSNLSTNNIDPKCMDEIKTISLFSNQHAIQFSATFLWFRKLKQDQ
jgi:hypothetical protein